MIEVLLSTVCFPTALGKRVRGCVGGGAQGGVSICGRSEERPACVGRREYARGC